MLKVSWRRTDPRIYQDFFPGPIHGFFVNVIAISTDKSTNQVHSLANFHGVNSSLPPAPGSLQHFREVQKALLLPGVDASLEE